MPEPRLQSMSGGEYNAIVYEAGKLHVRLKGYNGMRALCGRPVERWPEIHGHHWNENPDRRCNLCDCLGPKAVLKLL